MAKAKIIYEEETIMIAKYRHPKSDDFLDYNASITVKDSGKNPIELKLKFDGIYPFAAPMPPEQHSIKAPTIAELMTKAIRWFHKFGYDLK